MWAIQVYSIDWCQLPGPINQCNLPWLCVSAIAKCPWNFPTDWFLVFENEQYEQKMNNKLNSINSSMSNINPIIALALSIVFGILPHDARQQMSTVIRDNLCCIRTVYGLATMPLRHLPVSKSGWCKFRFKLNDKQIEKKHTNSE